MFKNCKVCGCEFVASRRNQLYCSRKCKDEAWRLSYNERKKPLEEIKKICKLCGREFITTKKTQVYCDKRCTDKANKLASCERKKAKAAEKNKPKRCTIADINEAARAAGMSYGKYVAMQYAKTITFGGNNESKM